MGAYAAEESDLDAVADDLIRLWSANLRSMQGQAASKLDWYYRAAPTGRGHAVVLRAPGGRGEPVVGCQGIGFRRVMCGERVVRAALLADLAVDAQHRTLFPALTLVRRTRELAARVADFQYGFPNGQAKGLFTRVGYRHLGNVARYARPLRLAPFIERRVRSQILARAAGAVLDAGTAALGAPARLRASRRYRLQSLPEPDPRFDALFDVARRQYGVIADRGREFLRWRFSRGRQPAELLGLVRLSDDALVAYAVIVRKDDAAHLADFLAAPERELASLLRLVLPALRSRGCASVSARFLGTSRIPRLLAAAGFRQRNADRAVVMDVPGGDASIGCPALTDLESFYLTDADEDE
jgi:hypothetical protein